MSIDLPRLRPPDARSLQREPQLALLAALDGTLAAAVAALEARHARAHVACWAPDDVRLAAAIVECARSLRQLIDDYDTVASGRTDDFGEIPF